MQDPRHPQTGPGPDVVFEVVDENALLRIHLHEFECVPEDSFLGFAHPHVTTDDSHIEHAVPQVLGIVIAP